jgi:subtilase family serine protease
MSLVVYSQRHRLISGLCALGMAIGLLVASPAADAYAGGSRTPSVGIDPHFKRAHRTARGSAVQFDCQQTTPAFCYGPDQIRAAYGVDKLRLNGAGRTIVIIDAYSSPTIKHDLASFNAIFGLPSAPFVQIAPDGLTPFDPNDAIQVGWSGEISLDVEWAHAIAPKAKIVLVLAKSSRDPDILSATKYAVDHNLGDVISQSFGEAEQCVDPKIESKQHALFKRATAKGITLLASAGDDGAAQPNCDGTGVVKAASSPASDPNVTAVGGTLLTADGVTGKYLSETAWNEPNYQVGSGGGFSRVYHTPSYQHGLQLKSRGLPDVSYNAGIDTGVVVAWSASGLGADYFFVLGGTSAGSPQWAGLVALADQQLAGRVGAINRALYKLASFPFLYSKEFHDIKIGDNTFRSGTTITGFAAKKGWDAATGLGTPKANILVPSLVAYAYASSYGGSS